MACAASISRRRGSRVGNCMFSAYDKERENRASRLCPRLIRCCSRAWIRVRGAFHPSTTTLTIALKERSSYESQNGYQTNDRGSERGAAVCGERQGKRCGGVWSGYSGSGGRADRALYSTPAAVCLRRARTLFRRGDDASAS